MGEFMKKIITAIILIFSIFLFTGCQNNSINEISYTEFKNKIESKDSFILYIGSASCHNCTEFSPKLEEVINEYKIDNVYYIDLDTFSKEEQNEFNKIINVAGTPNVVFINKGEEGSSFNRINGNVSKEKIIERLKSNDYIK